MYAATSAPLVPIGADKADVDRIARSEIWASCIIRAKAILGRIVRREVCKA